VLHRPKKSLGQNFLRDVGIVGKIVDALRLESDDLVIEIGPGHGALTKLLIANGCRVLAIEFDRDLIAGLEDQFSGDHGFKLLQADALEVDFAELVRSENEGTAKLVANLPYNISTPILQNLIAQRESFSELVLMFQREVVDRITAPPGDSERGFLTVLVENAFDAERLFDVRPEAFYPRPKVWSAVVRLVPKPSPIIDQRALRSVASTAFQQKRKTLRNNLKGLLPDPGEVLSSLGIDPERRAQTLSLAEWAAIIAAVEKATGFPQN